MDHFAVTYSFSKLCFISLLLITPHVCAARGCLSVCYKNIENTSNKLKYMVIHSEKGTITTFELFWEGHSAMYDLLQLQIQSFLNSYYRAVAPTS